MFMQKEKDVIDWRTQKIKHQEVVKKLKEYFPMIREREEFLNFCSGDTETDDNDTGTGECASGEGSYD